MLQRFRCILSVVPFLFKPSWFNRRDEIKDKQKKNMPHDMMFDYLEK